MHVLGGRFIVSQSILLRVLGVHSTQLFDLRSHCTGVNFPRAILLYNDRFSILSFYKGTLANGRNEDMDLDRLEN